MEAAVQLALPLFEPPSFATLLTRRNIEDALSVTIKRRMKRSWRVTIDPVSGRRTLCVPPACAHAPADIKNSLVDWALLPFRTRRDRKGAVRKQRRALEAAIGEFIESRSPTVRRANRFDPAAFAGKGRGNRWDLSEIFESVNTSHCGGAAAALVRWGSAGSTTSYHTTKAGSDGTPVHCITIGGAYNHPDVPRFAIESVMYHEMLHILVPPYRKGDRAVIHGREFKAAEKKFPYYKEWRAWERRHLHGLARRMRKKS